MTPYRRQVPLSVPLSSVLPGGLKATDRMFEGTHDGTCSRCGEPLLDTDVPLWFYPDEPECEAMFVYCGWCTDAQPRPANDE